MATELCDRCKIELVADRINNVIHTYAFGYVLCLDCSNKGAKLFYENAQKFMDDFVKNEDRNKDTSQ